MKVLIADDMADVRTVLKMYLKMQGSEVIEAQNGQEGIELAAIHKPDLIISDALMPKMDGFQFLRNIRQNETLKSIPFIFYSAVYQGEKDREFALSLGADAFIAKPKKPEDFWNEIQGILDSNKLKKKPARTTRPFEKEDEYLREYIYIIAAKLEEKVKELEYEVAQRSQTEEKLKERIEELEKFYEMAVGRELKMKELKSEIERLNAELSKYKESGSGR